MPKPKFLINVDNIRKIRFLPVIHSTTGENLKKIVKDKKLLKTECKFFKNCEYLYFYYGRACYRRKGDVYYSSLEGTCAFIFDIQHIKDRIEKIFPFDTRAFNLYKENSFLPTSIDVESFDLGKRIDVCKKVVNKYWGDNSAYVYAKEPKVQQKNSKTNNLNYLYSKLIQPYPKKGGIDDRASSIEIILNKSIEIDDLIGFIGSIEIVSDAIRNKLFDPTKVIVAEYIYGGETSSELTGLIKNKLYEILKERGDLP